MNLNQQLATIVSQINNIIQNHSADAINLALQATRWDGIGFMMLWGIIFMACIAAMIFMYKLANHSCETHIPAKGNEESCMFIVFIFAIGAILILFSVFLDIWNWIEIFNPKLYLAHEIINNLTN